MDVRTYLEQQQIHPQLIHAVEEFRNQYPVEEKVKYRVTEPIQWNLVGEKQSTVL